MSDSWFVTDAIPLPLMRSRGAEGPAEGFARGTGGGPEGKPRCRSRGGSARTTLYFIFYVSLIPLNKTSSQKSNRAGLTFVTILKYIF